MKNKFIDEYIDAVLEGIKTYKGDMKKLLKYVVREIKKLNK